MYLAAILVGLGAYHLLSYLKWRKDIWNYLKNIPGDFWYPIFGTTFKFIGVPREGILGLIMKTLKKYKGISLSWLGSMPQVNIDKAEYLETIMSSSVHINKGFIYNSLYPWLGTGLLTSGGLKWHQRRKLITPTFHFKILENFMEVFVEKSQTLLSILDGKCDGKVFNIYTDITHCALDIICETAMGVRVNAMSNQDNQYIKSIYDISYIISWRFRRPFIPDFVFNFMEKGRSFKKDVDVLHGFTEKVIADRKDLLTTTTKEEISEEDLALGKKKRTSFLDLLLVAAKDSTILTDTDIREEVDTFMFEGHDTTTAAMSWTLFLLGNHPDIQDKVHEEVSRVLQDKSTPTTLAELHEFKYLECVIKEALRMYPVVPIIGRKLYEEVKIGDYTIPSGTEVAIHIYSAHRSPENFPNPDKFNPDRFLPENSKGRHPYAFVPFSAGPRNCIGQKFAMYEEKTVLSSIINRYKMTSAENEKTIKTSVELILRPLDGVLLQLEKR